MNIARRFHDLKMQTGASDTAVALLLLVETFEGSPLNSMEELSHALCMGLRNGLMGSSEQQHLFDHSIVTEQE